MESSGTPYRSVCDRITAIRNLRPDALALKQDRESMSYRELEEGAARFAGFLEQAGVVPGSVVAICMERSLEWIVAALGILRVGAIYVPLDPAWPESRVAYAVEDSGALALVARTDLLDCLKLHVLGIDPFLAKANLSACSPSQGRANAPEDLAYLIYTSGSTGNPKGVEITHANLSHLIDWHLAAFEVDRTDRASHVAGLGFDAAVWEIWPTLSAGASLHLANAAVRLSPELLQQWIVQEALTISFAPTVHAAKLIANSWPGETRLRLLLTGGDALPHGPAADLPFVVVNNYGPTECTVVATSGTVSPGIAGTPTIGSPIPGAVAYVLDSDAHRVEDGQLGELYIGGTGVGRGYRNLPEVTRHSFLPDPFAGVSGARMYKTGDRVIRHSNGELEFHGRMDRQVKLRGQRIELDEIGLTLQTHPAVQFAVVMVSNPDSSMAQLVAYVLPKDGPGTMNAADLQSFLLSRLPNYMVPGSYLRLKEIPLTPNGKLDLTSLPTAVSGPLPGQPTISQTRSETERILLELVQDVLQNPMANLADNFFLAGGHSLLGMQLILRIRSSLGVDLTLRQLFDNPTAEELASVVEISQAQQRLTAIWKELLGLERVGMDTDFEDLSGDEGRLAHLQRRIRSEFGQYIPKLELTKNQTIRKQTALLFGEIRESLLPSGMIALQPEGEGKPLFWMHYPCLTLAKALRTERPFQCLMLTEDDLDALGSSPTLQEVVQLLVPKIVAAQPVGPYLLGGFCLGGILSYEVACQMQAAGHEVAQLVLLDTPSPEYYRPAEFGTLMQRPLYISRRMKQLGFRRTAANLLGRAANRLAIRVHPEVPQLLDERVQSMLEIAAFRYKPSTYYGDAKLILASELPPNSPPHDDFLPWWRALIKGELESEVVSGLHENLIKVPAVHQVAESISVYLAAREHMLA